MSDLKYFSYKGFGVRMKEALNYSQAVRIDNRIEISGQGGWNRDTDEFPKELDAEIDQAFDNVEHAIEDAGGKMHHVYKLRIFITQDLGGYFEGLTKNVKGRFPDHGPLLTVVQVSGLYNNMRLEIEAEAHLPSKL